MRDRQEGQMKSRAIVAVILLVAAIAIVAGFGVYAEFRTSNVEDPPYMTVEEAQEAFIDIDGDGDLDFVIDVQFVRNRDGDPAPVPVEDRRDIWPSAEEPVAEPASDPTPAP